jgi:uncharacterized protein YjbI with pentapeptide repeats
MANQKQLEILKSGVDAWNKWRREWPDAKIDLTHADLKNAYLFLADLKEASLYFADCRGAHLSGANLREVNFKLANLSDANLSGAHLVEANLSDANLNRAYLVNANLNKSNLSDTNLNEIDLRKANLIKANFSKAILKGANFKGALVENTVFGNTDLSQTKGLETIHHYSSSSIDMSTLQLSKGKIPEVFLRGCGLSDADIEYAKLANPNLTNEEIVKIQYRIYELRATQSIQISPLFISYSHADSTFVDALEKGLNAKGVRFWRDIHEMTAGRIEAQIDRAIRQNPTVLLILSKNSMSSDWVQHEVRKARELEKELGRDALCPIALDDGWKSSRWPQRVMEQVMEYNILDFSEWGDEATFQTKFAKLLNGLDLFYKKPEA